MKGDRLGEINTNNQGLKMTIIKDEGVKKIDVKFEDGCIVQNKTYCAFKNGNIRNPNFPSTLSKNREGEVNFNSKGLKMTIIRYFNEKDIDVIFEDGYIVKHIQYHNFKTGTVRNPNYRLNEENINNQGLNMKIIHFNTVEDLDVEFEDGTVVANCNYEHFRNGQIRHPYYKHPSVIRYGEKFKKYLIENLPHIELLSEYNGSDCSIKVKCKDCGDEWVTTPQSLYRCTIACRKCFIERISGENSPRWNPELTEEDRKNRRTVKGYIEFVKEVLKRDHFTCQLTGSKEDLQVHHLNGYNWCVEGRMDVSNAITICKSVHDKFHSIYGKGNNTLDQWIEFTSLWTEIYLKTGC